MNNEQLIKHAFATGTAVRLDDGTIVNDEESTSQIKMQAALVKYAAKKKQEIAKPEPKPQQDLSQVIESNNRNIEAMITGNMRSTGELGRQIADAVIDGMSRIKMPDVKPVEIKSIDFEIVRDGRNLIKTIKAKING